MSIRYYTEKGNGCGKSGNGCGNEFTDGKFNKIKVNKLTAKNLCAKNAKINNLEVDNFKFAGQTGSANINVNNITTNSIDTKRFLLNGKDLTCYLTSQDRNNNLGLDAVGQDELPIHLPNINDSLYNAFQCNAEQELEALRMRLEEGRQAISEFEKEFTCASCGPQDAVGISIYGYITRPVLSTRKCGTGMSGMSGMSGTKDLQVISSLSYNLEIDYDVKIARSTQPRVVSVLCQIAFNSDDTTIGPCAGPIGDCGEPICNPVDVETILIANKQYTPTLDSLYGEIFSGVIDFDNDLLEYVVQQMPNILNSAAVQLVFFVENGLQVYSPNSNRANSLNPFSVNTLSNETTKNIIESTDILKIVLDCELMKTDLNITATPTEGAAPLTVKFSANLLNDLQVLWTFGDGGTSNEKSPTYIFNTAGTYNVVLKVSGCPNGDPTASITITVT